jgi:hypothetical protein
VQVRQAGCAAAGGVERGQLGEQVRLPAAAAAGAHQEAASFAHLCVGEVSIVAMLVCSCSCLHGHQAAQMFASARC